MKFEPEHIEMTITDIPSIIGEEIGLWRVLQIYNYYVKNGLVVELVFETINRKQELKMRVRFSPRLL